jgi:hypothetical protein
VAYEELRLIEFAVHCGISVYFGILDVTVVPEGLRT